jgi:hypothetical protein
MPVLAGALCGLCVVVGCTSDAMDPVGQDRGYGPHAGDSAPTWPTLPGVQIGDQASTWWPVALARDLSPTGIDVVASSGIPGMVVDGAQAIWVDVPWGLARLDPASWSASAWDASDDAAFASKWSLRASATSGAWLLEDDHVRLFDGDRFVRDIQVPPAVAGRGVRDLIEVGPELWIASETGVWRCDGQTWSMVGKNLPRDFQDLQLTPRGEVLVGSPSNWGLWRWRQYDGAWWLPYPLEHLPVDAIGWDPTGALGARAWHKGMGLDSSAWQSLLPFADHDIAEPVDVRAVAASGNGTVWALTGEALLRSTDEGDGHTIAAPDATSLRGLAVSGEEVVVSTDTGVYRVAGDEFELVWSPDHRRAVVTDITDVVPVSGDQAWIVTTDVASGAPAGQHLQRVQVGRTDPVPVANLPASALAPGAAPVAASDGAIWYVTDESIVRIADGTQSVVATRSGEHLVNVNVVAMDIGGPQRADPRPREIGPDAFAGLTVPGPTIEQTLYGDGDITCPDHWAHDLSLPVGRVRYTPTRQGVEITVTLTDAWPDTEYDVAVNTDEFCPGGAYPGPGFAGLVTDGDGAGSLTLTYERLPTDASRPPGVGLLAGDDGGVWVLSKGWLEPGDRAPGEHAGGWEGLCLLTPDGQCTPTELPAAARDVVSLVGGTGGDLWATVCAAGSQPVWWGSFCPVGLHLMRWEAGWVPVAYPGADVTGLGAAPDGGFWGVLAAKTGQFDRGVLAHYREGRWTTFPELAHADDTLGDHSDYTLTPASSVCRIDGEGPTLVCVDSSLRISRTAVGVAEDVAVAADGAVWVWGPHVLARTPITVP